MEVNASLSEFKKACILSNELPEIFVVNSDVVEDEEAMDVVGLSPPLTLDSSSEFILDPFTPDSSKETGDVVSTFASPLSAFYVPPGCSDSKSDLVDDLSTSTECSTPKEDVFDSFAPGPDELMLAPRCTKYKESRSFVVRRLDFHSSPNVDKDVKCVSDVNVFDEDTVVEAIYEALLKAIISKQAEEILSEMSTLSPPSSDGCKTPTSAPRLSGIAETCPGAPLRPGRKLRNIDLGLRRKLEF